MGLCAGALLLLTLSALGGCATGKPAEEPPPGDDRLERTSRVALIAFQQGRYASAATLYGQVANLAYERDDVEAAVDAQYNAAVCLVRLDRVDEADMLLQRTQAELQRAGMTVPLEVGLLEAAILYLQQRYEEAWALTDKIISRAPASHAARRAQFVRGMIAADQGDTERLRAAITDLGATTDDRLRADRLELSGHLARIEQRYDDSVAAFVDAARLRSYGSDYRGTVRALVGAGEAAEAAGQQSRASVHYLRAGRSALHQGARDRARQLLSRARALAEQVGDTETAREAQFYLTQLEESEPASAPGG
jgi:tetratricopeptide (TPR) repeat protein